MPRVQRNHLKITETNKTETKKNRKTYIKLMFYLLTYSLTYYG